MSKASDLKTVLELAEGTYSQDRYRSWPAVAKALLSRGYTPIQSAAIMRSKWTRWAADNSRAEYGSVPASAILDFVDGLKAFYKDGHMQEVDALVDSSFNIETLRKYGALKKKD